MILGDEAYNSNEHKKALEYYTQAIACPMPNNLVFCNRDNYTWLPHDKTAMCYHHLKKYLEAIKAAADALQNNPTGDNVCRIGKNIAFWSTQL